MAKALAPYASRVLDQVCVELHATGNHLAAEPVEGAKESYFALFNATKRLCGSLQAAGIISLALNDVLDALKRVDEGPKYAKCGAA